jgi:LAO/AO transport system kinase
VEIAGVADTTVVVMVPESGDEVQTLKSGVMEIADVFVVNKSDREGATRFASYLRERTQSGHGPHPPVIETVATQGKGINQLSDAILSQHSSIENRGRKYLLMAEKLGRILARRRMADFNMQEESAKLEQLANKPGFNLYVYAKTI